MSTDMKFSEAIRLGAMLKPQVFGALRANVAVPHVGDILSIRFTEGTCAFGAAFDANAVEPFFRRALQTFVGGCPVCDAPHVHDLALAVIHLNDTHRWTREQIADWVATCEAAQASALPPSTNAVGQPTDSPICVRAHDVLTSEPR